MTAAKTKKAKPPRTQVAPTSMRLDPRIRAALEAAARKERRTLTSLAEVIFEDWLRERGYLK